MPMSTMMLKMVTGLKTASDYQMAVFQHIDVQMDAMRAGRPVQSAVVKAVAGSGKTTTAVAACRIVMKALTDEEKAKKGIYPPVMFLAFNKAIADELGTKLPTGARAKTLNALGFGILNQFISDNHLPRAKVDGRKTWQIMDVMMPREDVKKLGADINFLVQKCKAMGVVPAGASDVIPLNGQYMTDEVMEGILIHFNRFVDLTVRPTVFKMAREVLIASINSVIGDDPDCLIDFDDQKYLPVVYRPNGNPMNCIQQDVIFVDEAQDVNPVDLVLLRMSLKPTGLLVAIGDDRQAIYGFRGADVNSINNIKAQFNAIELPLSITYRCGKAIVEVAAGLYEGIEAAPNAIDGEVTELAKFSPSMFQYWGVSATEEQRKHVRDMVVCRNNAPLVSLAYKLIRARVPVHMMGRNFGKDLITLITKLVGNPKALDGKKFAQTSVTELSTALENWAARQIALLQQKDSEADTTSITDRVDTIRVFIDEAKSDDVQVVVNDINDLFNVGNPDAESNETVENLRIPTDKVILSSGHRSKGLEADRVFLLDMFLMYSQRTMALEWTAQQEKNLEYVMVTRAKSALFYIESKSMV